MTRQNTTRDEPPDETVSGYYENYSQTQREILAIELRKTRNIFFILAAIILASDLISLAVLGALEWQAIAIILIVPAVFTGLGFLASKEPLTAIIIASIVIIGLWIYTIVQFGSKGAISGWLIKAIITYFLIAGFQHAREAMKIKKELEV